ncbi:HlyD family efflux transporter periplasmic adaptor subunit [Bartonella sp. HY329]|uniref:HlyD family efflux transporter periplasmic adaptor subunit n=1 Tax=unclassified Bartonella TaxID=2645622 RepID=UPI0021CA69C4|nr:MULTISPECIES: HlyD family efflux transporter periplasmic adaptor subunit [unclassified Bartonella]UXM94881.1 HlyD family efflux transporter periplasmic adaptor subunit [Bartonella sp. HY329]UXN09204.1 HlyD family efflux transporter periplasmic adaptor subunit [Bartonella sp. HY328]
MKHWLIALCAFIVIALGSSTAFFIMHSNQPQALTLYGNVDIREVALALRISGQLSIVHSEEGDRVEKGEEIAVLDDTPYREKLASATAEVDSYTASLEKLVAGARQSEIDQAIAITKARQADLLNADQVLARTLTLHEEKTASRAILEQAIAQRDMAKANLEAAEAALRILTEGSRPEDINAAKAQLAAAKANQQSALTAVKDAKLIAPASGIIRSRVKEPGAIIATGEPIYILSLTTPLRVRGYIGEPDLGKIQLGQTVYIQNDSFPDKQYKGTIGFISSTAEFTPKTVETPQLRSNLVYRFWVTVAADETGLQQGMPVTITSPIAGQNLADMQ